MGACSAACSAASSRASRIASAVVVPFAAAHRRTERSSPIVRRSSIRFVAGVPARDGRPRLRLVRSIARADREQDDFAAVEHDQPGQIAEQQIKVKREGRRVVFKVLRHGAAPGFR